MAELFPSLISADLLNLQQQVDLLDPYVEGYHLDIMDFHFVPNLTWGPPFINALRQATDKPLFIHLMVEYPENYFDRMNLHEGDIVAIHYESPSALTVHTLFKEIRKQGWIPSIALNPTTSLESIYPLKDVLKNVLIMSVNPGFSGQPFLPHSAEKLKTLAAWRRSHNLSFIIGMDGGINKNNCKELIKNGADQLAIASAIFNHATPVEALLKIKKNLEHTSSPSTK